MANVGAKKHEKLASAFRGAEAPAWATGAAASMADREVRT